MIVRRFSAETFRRGASVLSVGYTFADERKRLPDPDRLTRVENDWTSGQVATSGGRLIGFCSANPLRDAALMELERCLGLPGMRGIKLHFGNGGISLRDSAHAARLAQLFRLAERLRAPVLVHMRARGGSNYGGEDARLFLERLVAVAPSIEIVVAHVGYSGPGYPDADSVMAAFGMAAERGDPRMRNVPAGRQHPCGMANRPRAHAADGGRDAHDRRKRDTLRALTAESFVLELSAATANALPAARPIRH